MNALNLAGDSKRFAMTGKRAASWLISIAAMSLLSHAASAAGMAASIDEAASVVTSDNRDMRTPNDWGVATNNRDMRAAPNNRDMRSTPNNRDMHPNNRDMRSTPNNRDMRAAPNNRDM